jgi:hypothetical protein
MKIKINTKSKKVEIKPKTDIFLVGHKGPEIGDIKEKIKYAYLPTKIDEQNWIWLEKYIVVYQYTEIGNGYNRNIRYTTMGENGSPYNRNIRGHAWVLIKKKYL